MEPSSGREPRLPGPQPDVTAPESVDSESAGPIIAAAEPPAAHVTTRQVAAPSASTPQVAVPETKKRQGWKVIAGLLAAVGAAVAIVSTVTPEGTLPDLFRDGTGDDQLRITQLDGAAFGRSGTAFSDVLDPATAAKVTTSSALADLVKQRHGHALSNSAVAATIQNNRSTTMSVTGVHAVVTSRSDPPPAGTLILPPGEGGSQPNLLVGFDLDQGNEPPARILDEKGGYKLGKVFGSETNVSLAKGEQVTIVFHALTASCNCDWYIKIDYVADGRTKTRTIGSPEAPFSISGPVTRYQAAYQWDYTKLVPVDQETVCGGNCASKADEWKHLSHG